MDKQAEEVIIMPDKKLTDSEIIKAVECCADEMGCIKGCPCFNPKSKGSHCTVSKKLKLEKLTIDLIKRQQAEIERLKGWQDLLKAEKHSLIKSEAYKEFAEMLISKIADVMKHIERNPYDSKDETNGTICGLAHAIGRIKDLLKEKVGENNA